MGATMVAAPPLSFDGGCHGCDYASALMMQIQPMMSAFGMPLCLLKCVSALIGFANAMTDALGPPPDPSKIAAALAKIATDCLCVAEAALPPPAGTICQFLKMVRDVVKVIALVLDCLDALLSSVVTMRVQGSLIALDPLAPQRAAGVCLGGQASGYNAMMIGKMGSIKPLLDLIEPIFTLLGAVMPPPFNATITALKAAVTAFNAAITVPGVGPDAVLAAIRTLAPVVAVTAVILDASVGLLCP